MNFHGKAQSKLVYTLKKIANASITTLVEFGALQKMSTLPVAIFVGIADSSNNFQ